MTTIIGFTGVLLLLVAYVLNLLRRWPENHLAYLTFNAVGASMACVYAAMSGSIPFVILEGVWGVFAFAKMAGLLTKKAPA